MIDGIVVQPATGSLVHCGQALPRWQLAAPYPLLAGCQSFSLIRKPGRLTIHPTCWAPQVQVDTQNPGARSKYSTWLRPRIAFRHTIAELL